MLTPKKVASICIVHRGGGRGEGGGGGGAELFR